MSKFFHKEILRVVSGECKDQLFLATSNSKNGCVKSCRIKQKNGVTSFGAYESVPVNMLECTGESIQGNNQLTILRG